MEVILAIIGAAITFFLFMIWVTLFTINQTLQRIIKRWAALENLGLFPEENEDA
jgi:hypothetical protein